MLRFRLLVSRFRKILSDDQGSISALFGIVMMLLFLSAGVAIDGSRAVAVKSKAQSALDAATLAASSVFLQSGERKPIFDAVAFCERGDIFRYGDALACVAPHECLCHAAKSGLFPRLPYTIQHRSLVVSACGLQRRTNDMLRRQSFACNKPRCPALFRSPIETSRKKSNRKHYRTVREEKRARRYFIRGGSAYGRGCA